MIRACTRAALSLVVPGVLGSWRDDQNKTYTVFGGPNVRRTFSQVTCAAGERKARTAAQQSTRRPRCAA